MVEPPEYIDLSTISGIAFEDKGPEFVNINLAGWSGVDVRKMSERVAVKEVYDRHYPITSGFVHGTWGAIREAVWETCANPLHRLYRRPNRNSLYETVESAAELVDEILQHLEDIYPGFPILGVFRLKGQSKRDSGSIVRSCKASQSPIYPIRDAILAVNHVSCPSLSSSGPRQWGETALKTSRLPGALSPLARSWLYPPSAWRRR